MGGQGGTNLSARDWERLGWIEVDGVLIKKDRTGKKNKETATAPKIDKKNFIFNIDPHPKPRMTQKDKWKDSAQRYFNWKDDLNAEAHRIGVPIDLPSVLQSLIFMVPMPKSWSKVKKNSMYGKLHEQKPDIDNYLKAFMDALCPEDSHIALINGPLGKYWNTEGRIILKL